MHFLKIQEQLQFQNSTKEKKYKLHTCVSMILNLKLK